MWRDLINPDYSVKRRYGNFEPHKGDENKGERVRLREGSK